MKKVFLALICILLALSLFACDDEVVQGPQGEKGETGSRVPKVNRDHRAKKAKTA